MDRSEIESLASRGDFNGAPLHASLEETHISWILLGAGCAFKIKKPVRLSFLDFSRVSQRRQACRKELRLNSRFSPIYQQVLPVREHNGQFSIGGAKGRIVDYAVVMRRLAATKKMDAMLNVEKVSAGHIVALAQEIAFMHSRSQTIAKPFDLAELARTFDDLGGVTSFASEQLGQRYGDLIERARSFSAACLSRYGGRINERVGLGYRRDVHGDLHCGNIFLYKKPVLFDCLEYNDTFRQIDVIDELAFLCMDMESYCKQAFSEIFLSTYCDYFPCFQVPEDSLVFIYYKCLRANIRAKVFAIAAQSSANRSVRQVALAKCRKYLDLMESYIDLIAEK
ncbi:hypothetical protein [Dyadobacter sp. BHUBP1]|uniref:hypothetical protein n=1 Tax=Dyadobacter sp. BHUBP1 TaxID=3424178 RepID=UPI003D348CF3